MPFCTGPFSLYKREYQGFETRRSRTTMSRGRDLMHMENSKMNKRGFRECVLAIVRDIPRGETMSYGEVARRAGFPGAARAVGSLMAGNHDPKVPCHRVIRSDGRPGEYNRGGEREKRRLLLLEGVRFSSKDIWPGRMTHESDMIHIHKHALLCKSIKHER